MNRIVLFLLAGILFSCARKNVFDEPPAQPVIDSIAPKSGTTGTQIRLYGSGFSLRPSLHTVTINGVPVQVDSPSTSTVLMVTVNSRTGTGIVHVKVHNKEADGPVFTYVDAPSSNLVVSTVAGSGTRGYVDGAALTAQFRTVWGLAIDYSGSIILGDGDNNRIRRISAGAVSTMAGSGTAGFADGLQNVAQFYNPLGVAATGSGTSAGVYVADVVNHRIRYIAAAGNVSTRAGTGVPGYTDGTGTTAQFARPMSVAINTQGILYVADMDNNCIRMILPAGGVSTLAGNGTVGNADGNGAAARFRTPFGVAVDPQGNVYVADYGNDRIRKITPAGVVTTLAGGNSGYQDGVGAAARFSGPRGVAADAQGNVYVADAGNHRIRKITPDGTVTTIAGSTQGYADGPALQARFSDPSTVVVDAQGNIYVGDSGNYRVRKISPQ